MNKKGFTLIEMIVVIALLSIVVVIAVPATMSIRKKILENESLSQINSIESAAVYYAQDNNISSECISVETLITSGYMDPTLENGVGICNNSSGCLLRPTDNVIINNNKVLISKSGSKTIATYYNSNSCTNE